MADGSTNPPPDKDDSCSRSGAHLTSLAAARARSLALFYPLPTEELPLGTSCGRVLARTLFATGPVPAFDNSAMDGYALRAADAVTQTTCLRVCGEVMAGDDLLRRIGPGEAMRIMTGAPLPEGADAVCMLEACEIRPDDFVEVHGPLESGENVRRAGEELVAGDEVFACGTVLRASAIGVLAALGLESIPVVARPRVGVASTGDELVEGSAPLERGEIRDINRPGLLARLACDGFEAVDLGIVPDDETLLAEVLEAGAGMCDAIVVSAGASRGDRDFTASALRRLGAVVDEIEVALRPGRPLVLGAIGERTVPVIGLAGNPVAAMVAYEVFVRPGLRRQAGFPSGDRPLLSARASAPYARRKDGTVHLAPVRVAIDAKGHLRIEHWASRGSHRIHSLAACNGLAVVPDGDGVERGDLIAVLLTEEPEPSGFELVVGQGEERRAG